MGWWGLCAGPLETVRRPVVGVVRRPAGDGAETGWWGLWASRLARPAPGSNHRPALAPGYLHPAPCNVPAAALLWSVEMPIMGLRHPRHAAGHTGSHCVASWAGTACEHGRTALAGKLRLAEAAGVLSLSTDLAMGQPLEHGLRTATLALRLAQAMGLTEDEQVTVFYTGLLHSAGCTA